MTVTRWLLNLGLVQYQNHMMQISENNFFFFLHKDKEKFFIITFKLEKQISDQAALISIVLLKIVYTLYRRRRKSWKALSGQHTRRNGTNMFWKHNRSSCPINSNRFTWNRYKKSNITAWQSIWSSCCAFDFSLSTIRASLQSKIFSFQ